MRIHLQDILSIPHLAGAVVLAVPLPVAHLSVGDVVSAGEHARVAHHRVEVVVDLEGARALRQPVLVEVLQVVVRDRVAEVKRENCI